MPDGENQDQRHLRERFEAIEDPIQRVHAMANDAAERAPVPTVPRPTSERRTPTSEERAARLESSGAKEAITPADYDRIVRGRSDGLFPTRALSTTQAWLELFWRERAGEYRPFMVLYGPTGRGKTVAGAWLIAEEGGLYIEAEELREVCMGGYRTDKRREQILGARVVVLDDLGTEESDAHGDRALYRFVNRRQGLGRGMTLVTSNLALRGPEGRPEMGLLTRYDERTIGRLQHSGRLIETVGDDLRRRAM